MRFAAALFATSLAFAQSNKVFQFTQPQKPQDLMEIANLVRTMLDVQRLSVDDTAKTLTVNASDEQVAIAGWLVEQLDRPAHASLAGVHEYRPPSAADDVVRVFYATHAASPPALQEIVTTVRSVSDMRRVFVYNRLKAVAVRDTAAKVSLAAWMIDQLNQPENTPAPEPHEFKISDHDVARAFELANPPNPQALQEITTLIRAVADMQRMFIYNARKTITLRGRPELVALAAWLVSELDRPASGSAAGDASAAHEYRLPEDVSPRDGQTVVRVFYLPSQSPEDLYKAISLVRANARIQRAFVYNTLYALSVRGTPGQIAAAEKTIEEIGKTRSQ